jgi:hypothetical protein
MSEAVEAQVADHVAIQREVEVQPVAAKGVVAVRAMRRVRQSPAIAGAAVVVHDHVAVQVGEVHQRSIRIASSSAAQSASISERVL